MTESTIVMPSGRGGEPAAERQAAQLGARWGHEVGLWVRQLRGWQQRAEHGRELAHEFVGDMRHAEGRSRHLWTLVGLSIVLGLAAGWLLTSGRARR